MKRFLSLMVGAAALSSLVGCDKAPTKGTDPPTGAVVSALTPSGAVTVTDTSGSATTSFGTGISFSASINGTGSVSSDCIRLYYGCTSSNAFSCTDTVGPTGRVNLSQNGNTYSGTLSISNPEVINYTNIRGFYQQNCNQNLSNASSASTHTVQPANVTLTVNGGTSYTYGVGSTSVSAHVNATPPFPNSNPSGFTSGQFGTVTFTDDQAHTLGTVNVSSSGDASLNLTSTSLSAGNRTISATYAPYVPSSGPGFYYNAVTTAVPGSSITVSPDTVSVALSGSPNPSLPNNSVTVTTLIQNQLNNITPTGTVTLSIGGTTVGTATCPANCTGSGNTASAAITLPGTTFPSPNNTTITASFVGNGNFSTTAVTNTYVQTVNSAAVAMTSPTFTPSSTITFGNGTTVTADVTGQDANSGVPSGTVSFRDGSTTGTVLCTGTLAGTTGLTAEASCAIPATLLGGGVHNVFAVYGGDGTHTTPTNSNSSLTVNEATPTVSITRVSPNGSGSAVYGTSFTFNATVTGAAGVADPTGNLTFLADGTQVPGCIGLNIANDIPVSCAISGFAVSNGAAHTITAVYDGSTDVNYGNVTGAGTAGNGAYSGGQVMTPAPSTVTVTSNASSGSTVGTSVVFTATLTSSASGAGNPTDGPVTFTDDQASPLNGVISHTGGSNVWTFTTDAATALQTATTHKITATYSPSAATSNFSGQSGSFNQVVTQASSTSLTVTVPSGSNTYGTAPTFTATVAKAPGNVNGPTPSGGKVTFSFTAPGSANTVSNKVINLGDSSQCPATATQACIKLQPYEMSGTGSNSYTVTATYSNDQNYADGTTGSGTETVTKATATIATVSSTGGANIYGQTSPAVNFTSTVSAPTPNGTVAPLTPSGSVTFSVNGYSLTNPTVTLNSSGVATSEDTATLTAGAHAVKASYGGDINYNAITATSMTSAGGTQTVTAATVNVVASSLASTVKPSNVGQPVTFSFAVATQSPGHGVPDGTPTFSDLYNGNTTVLCTGVACTKVAGTDGATYSFTTSSLAVGTHAISVSYTESGSTNFQNGGSLTLGPLNQIVNQTGITLTVASAPNPSTVTQNVTFTAVAIATAVQGQTAIAPTGTITFSEGATTLGTGTLSSNPTACQAAQAPANSGCSAATFSIATLTPGSHTITATYSGDANHVGTSAGSGTQVVTKATTSIATSTDVASPVFGQSVNLTATVSSPTSAGAISGSFTVSEGGKTIGTAQVGANGSASIAVSGISVGTHAYTIAYSGDGNYLTSTGAASIVVAKAATTTTLASSSNPSAPTSAVTFTATVTPTAPGAGAPTGTVTFMDGVLVLGTGSVGTGGVATVLVPSFSVGAHPITASYAGDGSFTGSAATGITQNVSNTAVTIAVTATPNPAAFGSDVVITATLTAAAGTPTGTISFSSSTTGLGSAALNAQGVATLTTNKIPAGTQTITASFAGDGTFQAGAGTTSIVIGKATSTTTVTSSANPSTVGASVTFTATVTSAANGASGTVKFFDGTTSIGTGTLAGGSATLTVTNLTEGSHSITATYSGNDTIDTSTSAALTQTVNAEGSTSSSSSSSSSSTGGTGTDGGKSTSGGTSGTSGVVSGSDAGTVAVTGGGGSDDSGCSSTGNAASGGAFTFLIGLFAVVGARRRRRSN